MKKGSYWFSFLSEKEQKEFRENVKNAENNFHELMNDEYRLFEYFIVLAFWHDETPQGHDYWMAIAKRDVQ
jgi:hypothetical protein